MSRPPKKTITKLKETVIKYPSEFVHTNNNLLWCKLCNKSVTFDKNHGIESHRKTQTHISNLELIPLGDIQIPLSKTHFLEVLSTLFLELDIPLYKIRDPSFQKFLRRYQLPVLSHSKAHSLVKTIADRKREIIKNNLKNKHIYLIADESSIDNTKFINIIIGIANDPRTKYLVCSKNITRL